jgi:hypothetical protein
VSPQSGLRARRYDEFRALCEREAIEREWRSWAQSERRERSDLVCEIRAPFLPIIQIALKPDERISDQRHAAQRCRRPPFSYRENAAGLAAVVRARSPCIWN